MIIYWNAMGDAIFIRSDSWLVDKEDHVITFRYFFEHSDFRMFYFHILNFS